MSNRTSYKFILCETRKECGVLDAPFKELDVGTKKHPSELFIRGYKMLFALYGVTYTLQFRILKARGEDTYRRLHVFIGIGEATQNLFGWYICTDEEVMMTPQEWSGSQDPKDGYNRKKKSYLDRVLNQGGTHELNASSVELQLDIDFITDNESCSTPTMIIKDMH